jgi:hypothetical protein
MSTLLPAMIPASMQRWILPTMNSRVAAPGFQLGRARIEIGEGPSDWAAVGQARLLAGWHYHGKGATSGSTHPALAASLASVAGR